jgi:hypothetical protein
MFLVGSSVIDNILGDIIQNYAKYGSDIVNSHIIIKEVLKKLGLWTGAKSKLTHISLVWKINERIEGFPLLEFLECSGKKTKRWYKIKQTRDA